MIEFVLRNEFLKSIFPSGIGDELMIGRIELGLDNRCSLSIHTQKQPDKDVGKWGKWGENYNVVVIELTGNGAKRVDVKNFGGMIFSPTFFKRIGDSIFIDYANADCVVHLEISDLIFQRCSTYIL